MMWKEFERLAGYEVSHEDYIMYIEPMYMAVCDDVTKQEFVQMVNRQRFALPSPDSIAICGVKGDFKSRQAMEEAAKFYAKRKYGHDLGADAEVYCYFLDGYEYPELKRGSYLETLVIRRGSREYARIKLQRS